MHFHKQGILYLTEKELLELIRIKTDNDIATELSLRGHTVGDLEKIPLLLESIANDLGKRTAEDRDEHEIFTAIFNVMDFFPEGGAIGFPMKPSFNPNVDVIESFDDLVSFREINSINDFLIETKDGAFAFQLKRYRGSLNTNDILTFLRKTIDEYYGQLRDTILLVVLQPNSNNITAVNFDKIHDELKNLNSLDDGTVLISYNANGKQIIMQQVHPERARSAHDLKLPSQRNIS